MGSFFLLLVYFLPIWFQAVKGASAVKSGIMNLPMILALVTVSVISGVGVTVVGYCELQHFLWLLISCSQITDAPLMIVSSVFAAIGAGLLSTLKPDSYHGMWIGYQGLHAPSYD
jgi:hypothetical protein